jgi:hypothetical protein
MGMKWGAIENMLGNNKNYKKKLNIPWPPPSPKRKKPGPPLGVCWLISLVAKDF